MAMTLEQLREEVIGNHGGITGKDTLIRTLLNLIVKDLTTSHNWRDLQDLDNSQTLAADAYKITVPSDEDDEDGAADVEEPVDQEAAHEGVR